MNAACIGMEFNQELLKLRQKLWRFSMANKALKSLTNFVVKRFDYKNKIKIL